MTGGILQIVARGIQDIFLTSEPQITFFKVVYRRHTNFSKTEFDLRFTNRLDFGKTGVIKIQRYGDLLHRLFLVIDLPEIELVLINLTIEEVTSLLAEVDIKWESNKSPNTLFNEEDFQEVNQLINEKITEFDEEIATINKYLDLLLLDQEDIEDDAPLDPEIWKQNSSNTEEDVDAYIEDVLDIFFKFDELYIQYKFVKAQNSDRRPPLPLANSVVLQNLLFEKFIQFGTAGVIEGLGPSLYPESFNDENLLLIFNIDTANYNVSGSTNLLSSDTVFLAGISNAYGNEQYDFLDAFKIFDATLAQDTSIINTNFDVERIKDQLIVNIRYGLQKNIQLLSNIYNSLGDDAKFMFYRLFAVRSGNFDTNSAWANISLQTLENPLLQDNYTTDFFPLQYLSGEPNDFFHPMSDFVKREINSFHTINRDLFRTSKFNNYFNQLQLWTRTDIKRSGLCVEAITGDPMGTVDNIYFNTFFLNLIPLLTTEDIPRAIEKILNDEKQETLDNGDIERAENIQGIIDKLIPLLDTERDLIIEAITPKICISEDFETIAVMNESFKSIQGENGDILETSIIRQDEFLTLNGKKLIIPEYVIERYQIVLDAFSMNGISDYDDGKEKDIKPILEIVLGLFSTTEDQLPDFTTYNNLNFNQRADVLINTSNNYFSDAISAIWYNLFKGFTKNYNSLYDDKILGRLTFEENYGVELLRYLTQISIDYLGLDVNDPQPIDYYFESTLNNFQDNIKVNNSAIGTFLSEKLLIFIDQMSFFDSNYGLLTIKNLVINQPMFYFAAFIDVISNIINMNIEVNYETYIHVNHNNPPKPDPVLQIATGLIDPDVPNYNTDEPHENAMDIFNLTEVDYKDLILRQVNPFDPLTAAAKFQLWNNIWLPERTFVPIEEEAKYIDLFGFITGEELYKIVTQIDVNYNGFGEEDDIYDFMLDIIIQNSFIKDIPDLKDTTVTETHKNIVNYLQTQRFNKEQEIIQLEFIRSTLDSSLRGGESANFAWIQHLGHYIINKIQVFIGDQLIDAHYGEWLHIWHELSRKDRKERGYNNLIGNVPELYTYNNKKKMKFQLIIPLRFWFCNNVGASLPMVALNNTDVKIVVKLRDFEEVSYFDPFTRFIRKKKLNCSMIAEYIFLENEERERIVKSKNEYLIETLQYNGDIEITRNSLDEDGIFRTRFYFKNPIKEFMWMLQRTTHIDGSEQNGERKYHNYGVDFSTGENNPAECAKIQFMSRDREAFRNIIFFDVIQPYERHYHTPATGINVYAFSLKPEDHKQPSGSANLGKIDDSGIEIRMMPDVIEAMKIQNIKFRWPIYATSYQILRVMSGLAGVAFFY